MSPKTDPIVPRGRILLRKGLAETINYPFAGGLHNVFRPGTLGTQVPFA